MKMPTSGDRVNVRRVLIVANQSSGRGAGGSLRRETISTRDALLDVGLSVDVLQITRAAGAEFAARFHHALQACDALVLAGGDGTIHHALPALLRTPRPIYHLPLGTENLFAREHAMTSDARGIARALLAGRVRHHDLGMLDSRGGRRPFAIMCSIGPDAGVVARLARERRGAITHLSYTRHVFSELLRPFLPTLTVRCDGRTIVDRHRGMLTIANSEQYALGINPAAGAKTDDGVLDLAFMPASSSLGALLRFVASSTKLAEHLPGLMRARGRRIEVCSHDGPLLAQADGESLPCPDFTLAATVRAGALHVMVVP